MLTFIDQNQVEYGAQVTYKVTNAVNGERSVSGTIYTNDQVLHGIDRGWRFRLGDEYFVVTFAKPRDSGRQVYVEFDAVHQFFWDFSKSAIHKDIGDGSHRWEEYLHFIFDGSGYSFENNVMVNAFRKESFGYKNRLSLFYDVIKKAGAEFVVHGRVVRILERVGSDLSTVVRKNFNMDDLKIEKDINGFYTFQKGFGAWKDDEDHSKGRLEVEYKSPLADEYGIIEGEPVVDERYTKADELTKRLKQNVDNSYSISVQLDMEDLTSAGYRYEQPHAGDYIMAINDNLGFRERIRIVSYTSEYDVRGRLVSHKVTCNDIGSVKRESSANATLSAKIGQAQADAVEATKQALRALTSADGKNTVFYGPEFPKDEPTGTLIKGDILFYNNGELTELYLWNGAEWEKQILGLPDEIKKDYDDQVNALKKEIDKLTKRDEDSLAEFDKKIAELRKQSLTPEAIDKALEDAGFKDSMDDIRKQLSTVSQTAKVNAELIGGDGTTSYNKNRLSGATTQDVTGDYVEVGHNGDGFEVGKSYVISWSAVCRPYGRQDVAVEVLTTFVGAGAVKLVPVDTRFPTIDKKLTKKSDSLLEVYLGQYRASFSGDWYQPVNELVTITDKQASWQVRPNFKTVADGQSAIYDGEWSDTPTLIFDGGRS